MNASAVRELRARLSADRPTYGIWVTMDSPTVSEIAAAMGLDWIVIDAEHGSLDWGGIAAHLRSVVRSRTVALVRLVAADRGMIQRALDLGADGVVLPHVETARELADAVAAARYPPEGRRGIGAERATAWGRALVAHTTEANEHVLVVPIIETRAGADAIGELLAVSGTELFQLGPADYSADCGFRGQWEGPGVADELRAVKDAVRAAGKCCGILARNSADLIERRDQGYRFLGLGMDVGLLLAGLEGPCHAAGLPTLLRPDLQPPS